MRRLGYWARKHKEEQIQQRKDHLNILLISSILTIIGLSLLFMFCFKQGYSNGCEDGKIVGHTERMTAEYNQLNEMQDGDSIMSPMGNKTVIAHYEVIQNG